MSELAHRRQVREILGGSETLKEELAALKPIQHKAIELLLLGHTISHVARECHRSRSTISAWMALPPIARILDEAREARAHVLNAGLGNLVSSAVEEVGKILRDPNVRPQWKLQAAKLILDGVGYRAKDTRPGIGKVSVAVNASSSSGEGRSGVSVTLDPERLKRLSDEQLAVLIDAGAILDTTGEELTVDSRSARDADGQTPEVIEIAADSDSESRETE